LIIQSVVQQRSTASHKTTTNSNNSVNPSGLGVGNKKFEVDWTQLKGAAIRKSYICLLKKAAWEFQRALATLNYLWVLAQRREVWVSINLKNFI
jgi:hypothetical protein